MGRHKKYSGPTSTKGYQQFIPTAYITVGAKLSTSLNANLDATLDAILDAILCIPLAHFQVERRKL
jgi:hypothetical protein